MRRSGLGAARAALAALALIFTSAAATAQPFPSRAVKVVVPFAAGGPLDLVGRAVFDKVSASLKQPFVLENRAGAGGNIGTEAVAKAAPDGYTLLLVLSGTLTANPAMYRKLPFNVERDLRPIMLLTANSQMMVVHPSLPARTLADLVAHARKEPLTYAHAGPGSGGHLAMEYFRSMAGFEAVQVPYRGNAPLVTDLVAGQVKAGFIATAGVIQHVRDGKLRGLAISSTTRTPLAPEVPTTAESGYPDFKLSTYFVLLAPAGLPDAIAELVEREVRAALQAPDLKERLRPQDVQIVASNAAEARAFLREDSALWARIAKDAKLQVD